VGKGVFYWYFASKEELFVEILRTAQKDLRRTQMHAITDEPDPVRRLEMGIRAGVLWMAKHNQQRKLFEFARTEPTFAGAVMAGQRVLVADAVDHLRQAIDGGGIPDRDPEALGWGILGVTNVMTRIYIDERGADPDEVADIAVWAVPFGLVGARLYHVITDWEIYRDRPFPRVLEIWNGGLGIPGGIFLGVVGGVLAARYYKIGVAGLADAMAPAIPLAQAIGRLRNYFNQELFGKPSTLPWAVRIDLEHRPSANGLPLDQGGIPKYPGATSFQPTFLYEALWNLGAFGLLVWIDSKKLLRQGKMLPEK